MNARLAIAVGIGALALIAARMAATPAPEPCGVACARWVLRAAGRSLPRNVRTRPNGMMSVQEVADLLTGRGLPCKVRSGIALEDLRGRLPAILHLEEGHFVVVTAIGPNEAEIIDPTFGGTAVPYARAKIQREWSGFAVVSRRSITGRSPAAPSRRPRA